MASKRTVTVGFLLALVWTAMSARVAYVQVWEADHYRELAESQSIRRIILSPHRGDILDRNGEKLALNAQVEVPIADENGKVKRINGLRRVCPKGMLAGQVLGIVGKDGYGLLGLEYAYDRELRGTDGWNYARHDVSRKYYPDFREKKRDPIHGNTLALTLDAEIQQIAERALERGVLHTQAKSGVAIVVEPFSGDILAMANYPFFDPNARSNWDRQAWKNHAMVMVYEPGSTFKAVTAAAVLEEGTHSLDDTVDVEGGVLTLYGETIRDTKRMDRMSFLDCMTYSSNVCFAKSALELDADDYYRYVRSFGFGMPTGVSLPAEESGRLKPVTQWSGRTQATMAFGHELSATPLQVVMAFAAIANGGMLMKPRLVGRWLHHDGRVARNFPPRAVRRVISERTAADLKHMLTSVVERGTADNIFSEKIPMAGKTGTAEKIDPETGQYLKGLFHSSFVGMVPVDRPRYVCLVLIDEPQLDKYGGRAAAPVFREIVDRLATRPGYGLAKLAQEKPNLSGDSLRLPDLSGYTLRDAKVLLGSMPAAFQVSGEGELVVEQSPAPGRSIPRGGVVRLTAGGIRAPSMPDVMGLSLRDALLKLKNLGLDVGYAGTGKVILQSPEPGATVRSGQKCRLQLGWDG